MFLKILCRKGLNIEKILKTKIKFYHVLTNQESFLKQGYLKLKPCYNYKNNYILCFSSTTNPVANLPDDNLDTVLQTEATNSRITEFGSSLEEPAASSLLAEPSSSSLTSPVLDAVWTPNGVIQSSLDYLHVNCDLPWWQAIVVGTIVIRFLMFPLVILAQRNVAEMNNHLPTIERLQAEMTEARKSGQLEESVEASRKLFAYLKVNKVNPLKNFLVPMAQVPVFISVFTGIREMANLPVVSLKTGGTMWFTDLTIADPYFLLPLLTVTTLAATIELGADGFQAKNNNRVIKIVLRSIPIITFPIICTFPAAMLCYWFTSNTFTLIQVAFLKIPQVRKFFKIPVIINHETAYPMKIKHPKPGFMEGFLENFNNSQLAGQMAEREKLNALKLKEATKDLKLKQRKQ